MKIGAFEYRTPSLKKIIGAISIILVAIYTPFVSILLGKRMTGLVRNALKSSNRVKF